VNVKKKVKLVPEKTMVTRAISPLWKKKKSFTWHLYGLTPEWDRLCLAREKINLFN
jgi:hypothetical protein